jgi:hypothetical protein
MVTRRKVVHRVPPWSQVKPEILNLMDLAQFMKVSLTRRMIKEAIRAIKRKPLALEESRVRRSTAMRLVSTLPKVKRESTP